MEEKQRNRVGDRRRFLGTEIDRDKDRNGSFVDHVQ